MLFAQLLKSFAIVIRAGRRPCDNRSPVRRSRGGIFCPYPETISSPGRVWFDVIADTLEDTASVRLRDRRHIRHP